MLFTHKLAKLLCPVSWGRIDVVTLPGIIYFFEKHLWHVSWGRIDVVMFAGGVGWSGGGGHIMRPLQAITKSTGMKNFSLGATPSLMFHIPITPLKIIYQKITQEPPFLEF